MAEHRLRIPALGPRGEGWVALQGVCFALIVVAVHTAPTPTDDESTAGVRMFVGSVLGILAAVFLGSGIAQLWWARAFTYVPRPREDGHLVKNGAYRLVRHPIYSGLILGALGIAIGTASAGTLIATGLLAIVLDLKRRREEIWLADRFPGYADYRAHTKALIPFLY